MSSLKIEPDFYIGYSVGELVCAYISGRLTLEETLDAAYHCSAFLAKQCENTSDIITVVVGNTFGNY